MLRSKTTESLEAQFIRSIDRRSRQTQVKRRDRLPARQVRSISTSLLKKWWIAFLLWSLALVPASALELRVAVEEDTSEVTVGSSTSARVRNSQGEVLGSLTGMHAFLARTSGNSIALDRWQGRRLWLEPTDGGYVYIGNRWYRGKVLLAPTRYGLTAVNYVDLEAYLYSVLGAEMSPGWHPEALKAQAVAARSYVLYQRHRYGNEVYDVGDNTSWQVYRGMEKEATSTHTAVNATRGQVLSYSGQVIEAVFHASSGGHTEDVENVWDEVKPYLRGVPDFDRESPYYHWTESFSQWELDRRLTGVGSVRQLVPERQSHTGRTISMKVIGDGGTAIVDGDDIRSALNLPSTLFTVTSYGDSFSISGRGFGHGVGMSQWGAKAMAERGNNYRQILSHYYRGTQLSQIRVQ
ncbi:MAG: SpoIID/LytB domain-containing protein [Cyanobacteria bacterium SID2]|nr:SpoIID/LytB domain-containing protein [Cyanobacteria bacterium SID2]MBP0005801.1 SpoIID/LytB domain-containing protein [Cyanobacteria bacterium SBC]